MNTPADVLQKNFARADDDADLSESPRYLQLIYDSDIYTPTRLPRTLGHVPILVGIYLLRTRSRRYPVSSLMLWMNQKRARQSGLRIKHLQTPLLFLLELLTLILLALAVAEPIIRTTKSQIPLIVVLDDSFSMLAGAEDSPKAGR